MTDSTRKFDVDLLIKFASRTLFNPLFTLLIPIALYRGAIGEDKSYKWATYASFGWFVFVAFIWLHNALSRKYRNPCKSTLPPFHWANEIVVITGGSSGIGNLLANALSMKGCRVIVLDVKPPEEGSSDIKYVHCDVSKLEEVQAAAKDIKAHVGDPTVLVNNAGVMQGQFILDLSQADIEQTLNVNILAHFNTIRTFLHPMIHSKRGHIITLSSGLGFVGCAQGSDYCASKAALLSLHDSLRQELDTQYESPTVRTTIVTPGLVRTPMTTSIETMAGGSPLPRWLHEFMFPPVKREAIVKGILEAIEARESREVAHPYTVHGMRAIGLVPYWVKDFVFWLMGMNYSFRGYEKTSGFRDDEQKH